MSREKYRDRSHCLLLYPDDPTHVEAMRIIERLFDYASILHDADVTEDGELKKAHWHVVLRFNQPRWSSALAMELGITENYIEKPRSFSNALLYLIHFNDPDKAQYSPDLVKGSLKPRLLKEMAKVDKDEDERAAELIEYIYNCPDRISFTTFADYCAKHGYWSIYRRSAVIFMNLIREHNDMFAENPWRYAYGASKIFGESEDEK